MMAFWMITRTGPISASRPAYITATRSAVSAITPMSWVISITAHARSAQSSFIKVDDLRLHGHVERRGRLVGDDELGSAHSASAITTRCRMPPENWCG
jgi:hypothetical protein